MLLEELFNRSLAFEVIRCMFIHGDERLYSAKIAHFLRRDPGNIHKIIDLLCEEGIVSNKKVGLVKFYILNSTHRWYKPLHILCLDKKITKELYFLMNEEGNVNLLTLEIIYQGFNDPRTVNTWKLPRMPFMVFEYKNDYIRCFAPKDKWLESCNYLIEKLFKHPKMSKQIKRKTEKITRDIFQLQQIVEKNNQPLSVSNRIALFDKLVECGRRLCIEGMPIVIMETGTGNLSKHVQNIIKSYLKNGHAKESAKFMVMLLECPLLTWSQYYRIALIEGAIALYTQDISLQDVARKIVDKFYWINFNYKGPELSLSDVVIELNELRTHSKDSLRRLKSDIVCHPQEIRAQQRAFYKQFVVSLHDQAFIESVALGNWLKLLRKDFLFLINSLVYRLVEPYKGSMTQEEMGYLTITEARKLLQTSSISVEHKILHKRKLYSIYFAKTRRLMLGTEAREFAKNNFERTATVKRVRLLEGQTASLGDGRQVEGIVKIVIDNADISKVNEGDILISTATVPSMVPAMKKAVAIVTDVGGITSHAAIVARELNKPCIIGTKNATKLFKDGDRVLVDVRHGYIKFA